MLLNSRVASKSLFHFAAEVGSVESLTLTSQFSHSRDPELTRRLINAKSDRGDTALMLATGQGSQDAVEYLVNEGAEVNSSNNDGYTALDVATQIGDLNIVKTLLKHGADPEDSKAFRRVYLEVSLHKRRTAFQKHDSISNTNVSEETNWDALMSKAAANDVEGVKRLLSEGADVEVTASDGRNALMIAGSRGSHKALEYLISMGCNIDSVDNKGWTTLMLAVRDKDHATVEALLAHGADVNHLSPDRWTALAEAAAQGFSDILQSLIQCGADTESKSSHDWTPLMHASYRGDKYSVQILLQAGARLENGSQRDETPLLLSAAAGHMEICELLLTNGAVTEPSWAKIHDADMEERTEQVDQPPTEVRSTGRAFPLGWTPLMVASQKGHVGIVRLLLEMGASTKPKSPMEKTALEIARENGNGEVATVLQSKLPSSHEPSGTN